MTTTNQSAFEVQFANQDFPMRTSVRRSFRISARKRHLVILEANTGLTLHLLKLKHFISINMSKNDHSSNSYYFRTHKRSTKKIMLEFATQCLIIVDKLLLQHLYPSSRKLKNKLKSRSFSIVIN